MNELTRHELTGSARLSKPQGCRVVELEIAGASTKKGTRRRDSHWQHPAYTSKKGFWRSSITVSVDILAQQAAEDGYSFYLSDNSVYLCKETLPVKYILGWHKINEPMPYYERVKEVDRVSTRYSMPSWTDIDL